MPHARILHLILLNEFDKKKCIRCLCPKKKFLFPHISVYCLDLVINLPKYTLYKNLVSVRLNI